MAMDSTGGYDGAVTVVLATGDTLSAEVNLYQARDGDGLVGAVHVPPQFESMFNDGDTVTLDTDSESGQFTVTGTVLIAGPKAGCFAQVGGDWT